ncbi:MAG: LysR substrate-binding domain-containing protein [Sutterella wadsworthensis]
MSHVSFASPIDLCRLYFSALVAKWADAHPGITFDIRPEATADDVRNGLVDVAVINYVPLDATGLVLRRYNSSRTPLLATPEYIRAHGAPSSPEDLAQHTGLLLETVMHPPTQILKKNGAASPILRWKEASQPDQMTLRELSSPRSASRSTSMPDTSCLKSDAAARADHAGWRREPWQMSVVTRWEDEARSKALSDFAAYVALEAEATWAPIREETNRVVEEAFRRRLRS